MIYSLSLIDIADAIIQALRTFGASIAALIYNLIVHMYNLFQLLTKAEILDNDFVNAIYQRAGLILGIFMLFKLTFSFIQSLIDPNKLTDNTNGAAAVIKRTIIAIVLLGTTPFIFREAIDLQNLIIGNNSTSNNVLYKLVVGNIDTDTNNFGKVLSTRLYFSLFRDDKSPFYDEGDCGYNEKICERYESKNLETIEENIRTKDDLTFNDTLPLLTYVDANGEYEIEYNWLLSVIVGGFVLYMLFIYCFQVGARVFQLAFLQLIAPIPILSYISTPEGTFKNWVKKCLATYLDLFIRLVIIYFVVYLSTYILEQLNNSESILMTSMGISNDNILFGIIEIILIISLLMFGKKVPELIKDLFPSMGGSGLSLGLKMPSPLKGALAFGTGAVIGGVGAAASNTIHGFMNTRKKYKEIRGERDANGDFTNSRLKSLWMSKSTIGKGAASIVGGVVGGMWAGRKTKDIRNVGNVIRTTNENRDKREIKAAAGYHWYNPIPSVQDKVLGFAGEKTNAEQKIKEANFTKQGLERAKQISWNNFAEANPNSDLGLLSSMHETKSTMNGNKVWVGVNSNDGKPTYYVKEGDNFLGVDFDDETKEFSHNGNNLSTNEAEMISKSAQMDKAIGDQSKVIKGLEAAKNDANSKK